MRPYTKRVSKLDPAQWAAFLRHPVPQDERQTDVKPKRKTERKPVPVCNRMGKVVGWTEGSR